MFLGARVRSRAPRRRVKTSRSTRSKKSQVVVVRDDARDERFDDKAHRRFNAGIAEAWTEFVREASRCARALEAPLPKHALVDLAEAALRAFAPGAGASESDSPLAEVRPPDDGDDPAHARLCAAHVVRHGALPHLDESGRRALTERLMELLAPGGARDGRERAVDGDGDDDADTGFPEALSQTGETKKTVFRQTTRLDARPPSASATLLCCVAALRSSGRVDGELFDTARSSLFTSASALECPRDAAKAVGALASAAPERAAALLRDATQNLSAFLSTRQSALSVNGGHLDPADHASARLSARVAAVLVAEADAFELGLPVRDVADAARAAFALATTTLPKKKTKTDSAEDVSIKPRFDEKNALLITRAFAWETVASALAFFAANRDLFARDEASIQNSKRGLLSGLDVAAVRGALAEALDPRGLIAAVAEAESEKAKAAEKEKAEKEASATSAASRLASLSMFSPSKKRGPAAETSDDANANVVSGSSSYGSTTAETQASSLPGSPRRNGGHSRSNSSLSLSGAESAEYSTNQTWAPASLLRLCAAAADAVAPFALFSRSENAGDSTTARLDALPLLRDALSCACHPVPVSGSSASGVARCAWPADPETANAAATLRLRALEAFVFAPAFLFDSASPRRKLDDETLGDKSSRMSVFDAAVGACAALPTADLPNADLPDHERTYVSSSPDLFLRRALNSADAPLGPWHGEESDAASGSLRRFEGANDAPPFSPWRLSSDVVRRLSLGRKTPVSPPVSARLCASRAPGLSPASPPRAGARAGGARGDGGGGGGGGERRRRFGKRFFLGSPGVGEPKRSSLAEAFFFRGRFGIRRRGHDVEARVPAREPREARERQAQARGLGRRGLRRSVRVAGEHGRIK
jgi:hypothetical protein